MEILNSDVVKTIYLCGLAKYYSRPRLSIIDDKITMSYLDLSVGRVTRYFYDQDWYRYEEISKK